MVGSSAGIFSRAAVTTAVARSSGRTSFSDPLNARPIGLRAVETMTASGTVPPGVLQVSKRSAALPPMMLLRCQVRVGVGLVSSVVRRLGATGRQAALQGGSGDQPPPAGDRLLWPPAQDGQQAARAPPLSCRGGRADLGAGVAHGLHRGDGDRLPPPPPPGGGGAPPPP